MTHYTKKLQVGGLVLVPKSRSSEVKEHLSRTSYDLLPSMKVRKDTPEELTAAREARIAASVKARKNPWTRNTWRQRLAAETAATGDKLSLQQLPVVGKYIPNILDATGGIGNMASALGAAPLQAQQTNSIKPYLTAAAMPLAIGAVGGLGAKNSGQFINNMVNPLAGIGPTDAIKKIINKKFIPNIRTRVLPNTLVPEVNLLPEANLNHRIKVMLNNKKGKNYGYLDLEEKPNWAKTSEGTIAVDSNYKPIKGETEWMRPMNIQVDPALRGNKAQDVLYQMGINESKKQGYKGVFSGEDLVSPQNTVKAHSRFNREVLGSKSSLDGSANTYVKHDLTGLIGHTNPNIIKDWLEAYKGVDKFSPRKYSSISDIGNSMIPKIRLTPNAIEKVAIKRALNKLKFTRGLNEETINNLVAPVVRQTDEATRAISEDNINRMMASRRAVTADTPLPKELEPYISKKVMNDGKEQHVFESAFPPEVQSQMIEERTRYFDPNGNVIPKPGRFLKTGGLFYSYS